MVCRLQRSRRQLSVYRPVLWPTINRSSWSIDARFIGRRSFPQTRSPTTSALIVTLCLKISRWASRWF